jgi:hypothetical protein
LVPGVGVTRVVSEYCKTVCGATEEVCVRAGDPTATKHLATDVTLDELKDEIEIAPEDISPSEQAKCVLNPLVRGCRLEDRKRGTLSWVRRHHAVDDHQWNPTFHANLAGPSEDDLVDCSTVSVKAGEQSVQSHWAMLGIEDRGHAVKQVQLLLSKQSNRVQIAACHRDWEGQGILSVLSPNYGDRTAREPERKVLEVEVLACKEE